ncbi:hypothetical protein CDD80_4853 [Ophiocordyceps camponoti-rufipedis]|uniref:Uncharacterized protein n=1 Tax=Ophiocordyceps camponoti-rufipedis TaxID=2004952 RepID=A0A2C5YW52_9HYPO|nr:hypothetical protein CDD80_4853 [Ophiocordyceps camponoti-rufipedis]
MFLFVLFVICVSSQQYDAANGNLLQPIDPVHWWAHHIAGGMIRSQTGNQQQPSLEGVWPSSVDWGRPPIYERSKTEGTCFANWFTCSSVHFTFRKELVNDPIPPPFVQFLPELPSDVFEPKATLFATKHQELIEFNKLQTNVTLSIEKITRAFKFTDDWKIEATLDKNGIISFHRGDPSRVQKMGPKSVVETFDCPARRTCIFETWTIHAALTGYCRRRPSMKCGGEEEDICSPLSLVQSSKEIACPIRTHQWADCSQFNDFVWNNCYQQAADKCFGPTAEVCKITTPVLYNDEPLFIVIPRAIPVSSNQLTY